MTHLRVSIFCSSGEHELCSGLYMKGSEVAICHCACNHRKYVGSKVEIFSEQEMAQLNALLQGE